MTTQYKKSVIKCIEKNRDSIIDLLEKLIRQKSVTGNEKPVQDIITRRLESLGSDLDVWDSDPDELRGHPGYFETSSYEKYGYDNRPNVVAVSDGVGEGRSLTLSGHIDVVPVNESEWTYDPWDPVIDGGRLYGRGSNDMLGGVASMVVAYEVLDDLDIQLAGDLILQTTIEEEDGGVGGVLSALERGYQPDAAIITEPSGVPDIGMASAGVMYFRITVPGKSSHAARGYDGVNAIGKATQIYRALDELDQERKARVSFEPAFRQDEELCGHETNLNIGVIESGDWPSTVPAEAHMKCRIGWPPGETRAEVRADVEEALQTVVDADEWLSEHPPTLEWYGWNAEPHELDPNEEIVQLASNYAEEIVGRETTFGGGSGGNDERFYNLYYDIPCPSIGPRGQHAHGADEYVEVDSLVETAQILALTTIDWCGTAD